MQSLVGRSIARLRHAVARWNSRHAWRERVGLGLLVAGLILAWHLGSHLSTTQQMLLGAALLLALAVVLRRGWFTLIGPLLPFELVRTARRSRYALLRLYVYFILIVWAVLYVAWSSSRDAPTELPADQAARMAEGFGYFLLSAQLILTVLVVPGYAAGAISEEKERGTLEALLASDLHNREIVLSKLLVRLGNLALMLLTGLPILSLLQFLGGLQPELVLAGFAVALLTAASLVALSLLNSVYARRTRDAILYTYLELVAYLLITTWEPFLAPRITALPVPLGVVEFTLGQVLYVLALGNPLVMLARCLLPLGMGGQLYDILPGLLASYALFHGLLTLVLAAWASLRLRAVYLEQVHGRTQKLPWIVRLRGRPHLRERPMLWKEVFLEGGLRFGWFGKLILVLLVGLSFLPPLLAWLEYRSGAMPGPYGSERLRDVLGHWSRIMTTLVGCLLLVGVAVRAATAVSGERDRQTLDGLLTTPLESSAILGAKWLGSIRSVRAGWLWMLIIWLGGAASNRLHPLAVPLFLLAWLIYAAVIATAGLWFSIICRNTLRALVCTLLTLGALGLGFLVLPLHYAAHYAWLGQADSFTEWLNRLQLGLAPPIVLGRLLPYWRQDALLGSGPNQVGWEVGFAYLGLGCWLAAGLAGWWITSRYFRRATGREALPRAREPVGLRVEQTV